jgi:Kef-type K+ transport system membrane component KefB
MDSFFSFTDLPIKVLFRFGVLGLLISIGLAVAVLTAKALGTIPVPGYAATVLTVTFFSALNSLGLGIIGGYAWRTYENTKSRPNFVVASRTRFGGEGET